MALTKSIGNVAVASATNTAGSTANSSGIDLSAKYETTFYGRITNGGTGPTIPCAMIIQVTPDGGSTWLEYRRQTAGATASIAYDAAITVPLSLGTVRVQFTGNTAQSVTIAAWYDTVSAL